MAERVCTCEKDGLVDRETGLNNYTPERFCKDCTAHRERADKFLSRSNQLYAEIKREHPDWCHSEVQDELIRRFKDGK